MTKWVQSKRDIIALIISSVQFSHSVVSDSLRPHESQHTRPLCPSPTPGVYSDSCPSSQWCHPAISSCRPLLLPPIPPSITVFSNESTLRMRWPKYWSFSFSIIPCKEIPGLISFRMDLRWGNYGRWGGAYGPWSGAELGPKGIQTLSSVLTCPEGVSMLPLWNGNDTIALSHSVTGTVTWEHM